MLRLARGFTTALAIVLLSTTAAAQEEKKIAPLGFEVSTKDMTQCGNVVIQW